MGSVYEIYNSPNVHRVRVAEYESATQVRTANNKKEAAAVALAEFSRSLGNNLRIEQAGKRYNEEINALAQTMEGRATVRLSASLAASEKLGQLQAGAAAAGVGGSSIELLGDTVTLQRNIEQDLQRVTTERIGAAGMRTSASSFAAQAVSQDFSRTLGNFDYTINVAPQPLKHRYLKLLGVAAATYFGGPQAGQAAADAAVGEWKQNNGDWDGAARYLGRATSGLIASVKDWGGGDSDSNSWFGRVIQSSSVKKDSEVNWGDLDSDKKGAFSFSFGKGFGDWFGGVK